MPLQKTGCTTNSNSIFIISLGFALLLSTPLIAQNDIRTQHLSKNETELKFDHLSVKQGLSQGNTLDIIQDKFGFLWIATEDGLNLFDGYHFTIYRNDPKDSTSISNNNIYSISEDKDGNLWVGTQTGLNFYDRSQNKFVRFFNAPNDNNSISNNTINAVFFDSENKLWVGTADGLNQYDPKTNQFIKFFHQPKVPGSLASSEVRAIMEDHLNRLWVGTSGGLCMLNADRSTFTSYSHDAGNPASLSSDRVRTIFEDHHKNIWVGTFDGGLNKMKPGWQTFIRYSSDPNVPSSIGAQYIHEIGQNKQGEIWIATDGGLSLYNGGSDSFTRIMADTENEFSLSSNIVMNVFFDRNDRMWVGTRFGGVNIYEKEKYAFRHIKHKTNDQFSLSGNTVNSFCEDEIGNFYVAIDGGGLDYYDRATNKFTHLVNQKGNANSLANNKVLSVKLDSQGGLWIGYWGGGLDFYDRKTKKFKHYRHNPDDPKSLGDDNVFYILEDQSKDLWFATYGNGICKYDRKLNEFKTYSHNDANPNSLAGNITIYMLQDHDGKFWIATRQNGLEYFDPATETFTHYKASGKKGDLSEDAVFSLYEDSKNRLWVGTNGGGLNLFDRKTKTFTVFNQSSGLPNDVIMGILEDNNKNLWISTNKGLCKFNPDSLTYKNYDEGDGLQSNQFNRWAFLKLKSGELLFGGVNGYNLFNPEKIEDNTYVPPVFITDFKLFNKFVSIGKNEVLQKSILFTDKVELSYSQNFFSFEFTALNYRQAEKNKYKYIMEGFQDEWIDAGTERKVSYTNLNPGEYVFRVIASNNDGIWNKKGTSIKIIIVPPFWRTKWFLGTMAILIVSGIVSYIRYQRTESKRKTQELQAIIEEQTSGLKKQNLEIARQTELEKNQHWIMHGLAQMGEIVSKHKGSMEELADEILRNLVRYVSAQQGVLILASKEDPTDEHLRIVATYGVNKDRLESTRIEIGEGILGSAYKDKQKIHLTRVPANYIKIESGLGAVRPASIIVLPLKSDDEVVHGLVELAFMQETSELVNQFLDALARVLALNINSVNLNERTAILLKQSKEQTEEMRAQEEEMRQNMEELEATQEELRRREEEYQARIKDLEAKLKA